MRMFAKKAWIVFALLVSSAVVAHQLGQKDMRKVTLPEGKIEAVIPTSFSGWHIDENQPVVIADPQQQETLQKIYSDTLSRTYVNNGGGRVMLSLAYGANQSEGLQVHFPEVCYHAQGFSVGKVSDQSIDVNGKALAVRRLVARVGARNEPITYWVVVGDQIANKAFDQKFVLLRFGAKKVTPDGLLFRVSSIGVDESEQYKMQEQFLRDLFAAMKAGPQARLLGTYKS